MKSLDNYWSKNLLSRSEMKTIIAGLQCSQDERVAKCYGQEASLHGSACVSDCEDACDGCKDIYPDDTTAAYCDGDITSCC